MDTYCVNSSLERTFLLHLTRGYNNSHFVCFYKKLSPTIHFLVYIVGNVINIQTGEWVGAMSGLGAGIDSFFEYLLKVLK